MRASLLLVSILCCVGCDKKSDETAKAKEPGTADAGAGAATGTATATGDDKGGVTENTPLPLDGPPAPVPAGKADQILAELDAIKARGCACTDAACADTAQEELAKLIVQVDGLGDDKLQRELEDRGKASYEALMACLDKARGGGGELDWNVILAEFEQLKNKMCDCKDKACAEVVAQEHDLWEDRMKQKAKAGNQKPPPEIMEKGDKIDDELDACRDILTGGTTGKKPAGGVVDLNTGIPECDQFLALQKCVAEKSGQDMDQSLADMAAMWRGAAQDPDRKKASADECKAAVEASADAWKSVGCM